MFPLRSGDADVTEQENPGRWVDVAEIPLELRRHTSHSNSDILNRRTAGLGTGDDRAVIPGTVMKFKGVVSKNVH